MKTIKRIARAILPGKHTGIVVFTTIVLYHVLSGESDAAGGIFSSSRGLGYNPRGAGRHDYVEPDCALRNHYTINLKKWRDAFTETEIRFDE